MAFDLSWLWNVINTLVSTVQQWFSSLWQVAQNIVNTGQGIFAGLVAFGSQLWDAVLKGLDTFGKWVADAFNWIYAGLKYWADVFGSWINQAFAWIGSAFSWVAQQIYNFGAWLYNGLVYVWNWIVNTAIGIWNAIIGWFSGVASAISGWWGSVVSGVNAWFTNLLKGIRRKILQTIIANVSIYFGWKSVERITQSESLKDGAMGVMGLLASPFVGYLFGSIAEGLIPLPSTTPYQLIPEIPAFGYTPPALGISTPIEKPYPDMGKPLTPIGWFTGTSEVTVKVEASYDADWTRLRDAQTPITTSYDVTQESSDRPANILLSYETVIA